MLHIPPSTVWKQIQWGISTVLLCSKEPFSQISLLLLKNLFSTQETFCETEKGSSLASKNILKYLFLRVHSMLYIQCLDN